jgi:hypothetical protein
MSWDASNARVVREMINQESNLTDQRLRWLTTLQGLLFAALGFAADRSRVLIFLLAAVGIFTSLSVFVSLCCAAVSTRRLKQQWRDNQPEDYNGPPVIGISVPPWIEIFLPWFSLPAVFILVWITIAIIVGKRLSL